MKIWKIIVLWSLMAVSSLTALSFDTSNQIFHYAFQTLKVSEEDDFLATPVIRLGADTHIIISFDKIADDIDHLRYRILHCNYDWQPSGLLESEYVDGFNIAPVDDYAFSCNTFVHFVNYRITLPNSDMVPLVSGNYLLQIFDEQEPDHTLLQTRFCVSEEKVIINGDVSSITDRGVNEDYQQLQLIIDRLGYKVQNPISDIIITVEQNDDATTLRRLPPPLRMDGERLIYEHLPQLIFEGGNEFRRFETSAVPYPGMNLDSIRFDDGVYHAYITPDVPRVNNYIYDQTQHGRYLVRHINATDSDLGADYVTTHFELQVPEQPGAEIFVQGEMTEAWPPERKKMTYNNDIRAYTLTIPLKQGAYNYQYVLRSASDGVTSPKAIEGNHFQTRNKYTVKVYLRTIGSRGDKLIGVADIFNYR